jgi:hypothetical protein
LFIDRDVVGLQPYRCFSTGSPSTPIWLLLFCPIRLTAPFKHHTARCLAGCWSDASAGRRLPRARSHDGDCGVQPPAGPDLPPLGVRAIPPMVPPPPQQAQSLFSLSVRLVAIFLRRNSAKYRDSLFILPFFSVSCYTSCYRLQLPYFISRAFSLHKWMIRNKQYRQ